VDDNTLYNKLASLPDHLKAEVADFIDFLAMKERESKMEKPVKQRKFGSAKGFFKMHDDFDEPLEDFKDYM
jgi:Protein of unknown function (DUF2281)